MTYITKLPLIFIVLGVIWECVRVYIQTKEESRDPERVAPPGMVRRILSLLGKSSAYGSPKAFRTGSRFHCRFRSRSR